VSLFDDRRMKPILVFALLAVPLFGCETEPMRLGGAEASQCEAAYAESRGTTSRSDFLTRCASARWVAVCKDGSASFSDDFSSVCAAGGGVATWHRVVDG
jgi:hypothetical protein